MAEKTDLRKVQAALDRAAKNGVSGPREARAGRFGSNENTKPPPRTIAASVLTQAPKRK
jgi:hypothetical protein